VSRKVTVVTVATFAAILRLGCNLSIKLHFLHSHLANFPNNLGTVSDEYQDCRVMSIKFGSTVSRTKGCRYNADLPGKDIAQHQRRSEVFGKYDKIC
jgi:hypothetical protein